MLVNFQNESAVLWGFNFGSSSLNDFQEDESDKKQANNGTSFTWQPVNMHNFPLPKQAMFFEIYNYTAAGGANPDTGTK